MTGVPERKGDPGRGYNGVAGRNSSSIGDGSFCVSGNGNMSKCVDIIGDVGNKFHKGSCGLSENNCAEYLRRLVSSGLVGESSDSLSGITAGGDNC